LKTIRTSAAFAAAFLLSGCAGGDAVVRGELESLRAEVLALRQDNLQLTRTVAQLATQVDQLTARLERPAAEPVGAAPATGGASEARPPGVPQGLAVVKVAPTRAKRSSPVPTSTSIVEPDATRLEAISRKSGRDLASDAEAELKAARRREPLSRAHALEDFVSRYPRHPLAGSALLEASAAYAEVGKAQAACTLDRRVIDEYPASEQVGEALLQLAACERHQGAPEAERRLLSRVANDYPNSPAARRAREQLASIPGRPGVDPPPEGQARSGP
jgi:TolA-binding protein